MLHSRKLPEELAGLRPFSLRADQNQLRCRCVNGGALLIVGLLSRLGTLLLTIDFVVAILLVKANVGLIAPPEQGAGAELDLALIAGFLVILFMGSGSLSLDRVFRLEEGAPTSPGLQA